MGLYATAGMKLHIGGVKEQKSADFTLSDFSGVTWVEVKNLESMGSLGDTAQSVTFDSINEGRQKQLKGTRSAGVTEVVCGIDYADAGQIAVIAAEKTIFDYAFKVTFNDAPSGGDPSERYFIAKVMSASEQYDTANSVMKLNSSLNVNSNVVRVDASA